jgi:two-component system cell cycle sensor histidine kinase PleC
MSHELRTPLNAVIGFSDVMQRELFGPLGDTRYQEYARHIRDSGDALLKAAEDALAMTTLVASAPHSSTDRLTLAGLIEDAWHEVVARTGGRGVRLDLVLAGDLEIRANARAIHQALIHLLTAGLIRARPETALRVTALAAHGRVRIEVSAPEIAPAGPEGDDLALCLARTLLEVQGSALTAQRCRCSWTARTELEHAVQEDLFACAS